MIIYYQGNPREERQDYYEAQVSTFKYSSATLWRLTDFFFSHLYMLLKKVAQLRKSS